MEDDDDDEGEEDDELERLDDEEEKELEGEEVLVLVEEEEEEEDGGCQWRGAICMAVTSALSMMPVNTTRTLGSVALLTSAVAHTAYDTHCAPVCA